GFASRVVLNPAMEMDSILVPMRDDTPIDTLIGYVSALVSNSDIGVTLLYLTDTDIETVDEELADEEDEARTSTMRRARNLLLERGVHAEKIEYDEVVTDTPVKTVSEYADIHDTDAVVMMEGSGSIYSMIFGNETERVAAESLGPVVVVRKLETDERAG
ncbi:MAG: universal stress protein, partial [Halobacteria archaeon]|nr:universal stress protein [Halobacteria archaeon]